MSKPWEVHEAEFQEEDKNENAASSERTPLMKRSSVRYDCWGCRIWLQELHQTFGHRLLVLLFMVQHLLKGFAAEFSAKAVPYMFKYYSVPAPQAQVYMGVAALPWAMKPMIGVISDVFPIGGYNKAPYMAATCILGVASYSILGSATADVIPVAVTVLCLLLRNVQISTCDLLAEAKYSTQIRKFPEQGPGLLTYVWFGMQVCSLAAVAFSGFVLNYVGFRCIFLICIVPAGLLIFPLVAGYTEEPRVTDDMKAVARQRFLDQPEMCFLSVIMLLGTVSLAVVGMTSHNVFVNAILAIVVAVVVLASFSILLTPAVAKFNAFCLIQSSWQLSIGAATFYFYTDTTEQYDDGPHFSKVFYNSVLGGVSTICAMLGIWTYKRWLSTWNYRSLIVFTSFLIAGLNMLDLIVFTRVNKHYLGIPDEAFVVGASVMETVIGMWNWMPQVLVLSYMVPSGMESTMYGLLAGCANLGNAVSANCGALLLETLEVKPRGAIGEDAMFDKLWIASAISTVLPLLCVSTLFWLIPNKPQTECFKEDVADSPVAGSLWRRWRNIDDNVLPAST